MKRYFILSVLCFGSIFVFSQKLALEKASPFTAVKWEKDQPIVQFKNEWYHFEKLDNYSKKEILDFCKMQFGNKWRKRFSEDLVEVLRGLNYQPNRKVKLQLSKDGVSKILTGVFTVRNRKRTRRHYYRNTTNTIAQEITATEAIEDLRQFEDILKSNSSYVQLSRFNYKSAINKLSTSISTKNTHVNINEFTNEISKVMSEIGDRHSSIKNESLNKKNHKTYNLRLPFGIAVIEGKTVALKQNLIDKNHTYYYNTYPYLKSINGISVETLIDTYNYRDKKAPASAKKKRGANAIQKYGKLLFKNNIKCTDSVKVVFSNGNDEKAETVQLTTGQKEYIPRLPKASYSNRRGVENGNLDRLCNTIEHNIGYINIPRMYLYDEIEGLEDFIGNTLKKFSDTKALIIDIRNNPGGGRDILKTFASYIVQEKQSPWIANIAYLRTNKTVTADEESMSGRYLYSYNSEILTDKDRNAIDQFNANFKLQKTFDKSKFSSPFYMVLHKGKESYTQPVYILVNESSFSAATVFTSAFKGLPNVTIVGETTDGSSGNSKKWRLTNSNIRVKVSTMLSFQRNGKTLDGNGTVPDIIISADETQVLKGVDNQLSNLVEIINSSI